MAAEQCCQGGNRCVGTAVLSVVLRSCQTRRQSSNSKPQSEQLIGYDGRLR
jgi:hypothetical protein